MITRGAWYWPTPVTEGELAGRFHVVEGRVDGGLPYRLLVSVEWVAVSPLPVLEGLPGTQGFFLAHLEDPTAARVAVFRLDLTEAFFAADLAERLAAAEDMEVVEESPASHVDFRGVARGGGRTGFISVAQGGGYWHCAFGLGLDEDPDGLDAARAAWATFHLAPQP